VDERHQLGRNLTGIAETKENLEGEYLKGESKKGGQPGVGGKEKSGSVVPGKGGGGGSRAEGGKEGHRLPFYILARATQGEEEDRLLIS